MATFNDLNRVMEDTIRVDMKKRWTPQEVKFINNKNEYFGTFHGKIESTGATLTNVDLSNATIYNDQGEKIEINDLLKLEQRVTNAEDNVTELQDNVVVLSGDVQELKSSSTGIKDKLEKEAKTREGEDKALDEKITVLSNQIDLETSSRITAVNEIYSAIDEEVAELNKTIEEKDKTINDKIDKEVNGIYDDMELSVDTLLDDLLSTIANDKHYRIVDVSNVDKNYVLKDFAINNIDDVVSRGSVAHGDITIGKINGIERDGEGKITSITLATLRDFDDKEIEHCLPPNAVQYTLDKDNKFQTQVFDGYFLSFKEDKELSDCKFNLDSHRTGGCDVTFNGVIVGAVVDDGYDDAGNLSSGRLELVPGVASEMSAYNGRSFTFLPTSLEDVFEGPATGLSSKTSVVPALKKITLKQNFSVSKAIQLRNEKDKPVKIGKIGYGKIDKDSMTVEITENVEEHLIGIYDLSASGEFKKDIDDDYTIEFADDNKIKIFEKHNLYQYKMINEAGEYANVTVIPAIENRPIDKGTFDEISVVFGDKEIPSFEAQTVVLQREHGFTKTLTNDGTATILFNEDDNTLSQHVEFSDKAHFDKSYNVVKDEWTLISKPIDVIVETQEIDPEFPAYENTETDGQNVWYLDIGEHQKKEYKSYPLNVVTKDAGKLTLEFPKDNLEKDVSREFIARIKLHGSDGFVELNIADDVELDNRDREDLFVKGNETSTIQFRQVGFKNGKPLYLVEDLKEHDLTHFIEELHKEIENRKTADEDLSVRITKNEDDIADIYNRISGIINYKGVLNVNTNYDTFAKMFEDLEFDKHDVLSAGWFYLVESDKDPLYKHMVEGVNVGKGDYLKIENSKRVEDLLLSDVLILDTLDGDVVHVDGLEAVSSDLNAKIETEKTNITNMSAYVDGLCVAISSDVIDLNTEVHNLCSAISTDVNTLSGDFHDLADKTFLKPEDAHVSSYYMVLTEESHGSDDDRKPHPQYYMTFRDGTLVLVKKEDSSEKKEDVSEEKKED